MSLQERKVNAVARLIKNLFIYFHWNPVLFAKFTPHFAIFARYEDNIAHSRQDRQRLDKGWPGNIYVQTVSLYPFLPGGNP